MTQFTDQHLSAYIDGELSETLARQLEETLIADPALAARLRALEKANQEFILAHENLSEADIPQRLLDVLDRADDAGPAEPEIIPYPGRLARTRAWLMPLAACLVLAIGVGLGTRLTPTNIPTDQRVIMAGTVDSRSFMYDVLETVPSGQSSNGIKPILTYSTHNGGHCREVETTANRALACRDLGGNWNVLAIIDTPISGGDVAYQPASANSQVILDTLADQLMQDIPLSLEDERVLLREWGNPETSAD